MSREVSKQGARPSSSRAPGKGAEKAQATRTAIVEAAAELFAEKGYVETSMRDISRRASLTTGAVYGHFRNKADLLAEAINARIVEEFGPEPAEPPDQQGIRTGLADLARRFPRRRQFRALLVQGAAAAQTDPETCERLRNEQLAHLRPWIKGYEGERDVLEIDPAVDVEAAVLFTWAAEIGLGILEVLDITPSPQGWADAYDRLLRGLKLPPEQPASAAAEPKPKTVRQDQPAKAKSRSAKT